MDKQLLIGGAVAAGLGVMVLLFKGSSSTNSSSDSTDSTDFAQGDFSVGGTLYIPTTSETIYNNYGSINNNNAGVTTPIATGSSTATSGSTSNVGTTTASTTPPATTTTSASSLPEGTSVVNSFTSGDETAVVTVNTNPDPANATTITNQTTSVNGQTVGSTVINKSTGNESVSSVGEASQQVTGVAPVGTASSTQSQVQQALALAQANLANGSFTQAQYNRYVTDVTQGYADVGGQLVSVGEPG